MEGKPETPKTDAPKKMKWGCCGFLDIKKPLSPAQQRLGLLGVFLIAAAFIIVSLVVNTGIRKMPAESTGTPIETKPDFLLKIDSPSEKVLLSESTVKVSGVTGPGATVMFYTETAEGSVEADDAGRFEGDLELAPGINFLTVTAFGGNGEEESVNMEIVFDEEAESVLGVKNDKTAPGQIMKEEKTTVVVGTVEEVVDDGVTLKGKDNKNQKIGVSQETKVVGQEKKELKLEFLKPNDIAAVVATGDGQIKTARKVYVRQTAEAGQTKRRAVQGIIVGLTAGSMDLAHQVHRERAESLFLTAETVVKTKTNQTGTLADLALGLRVAAVGDRDDTGKLTARLVHVIPGKAVGIIEKRPLATPSAALSGTPAASPTGSTTPPPSLTPTMTPPVPTATVTATLSPTSVPEL